MTLVGKGVCFDTGGLDLKPESAMLIMKKDMGGAATVLALAHMIMGAGLKISLRVLIPAVENSVSGDAFRPLDVLSSRKGLNVEIGNTDAEGRLVLADALALADEETPDLLVDMGTLTGAARVALGPELPPYYTDDETLAAEVARHAAAENDPLWRLPLWQRYDQNIDSKIADVNNVAAGGMAGSIICALFLKRFVVRRQELAAFRHLRLDAVGQARAAGGRRMPGGAGALCAVETTLRSVDRCSPRPKTKRCSTTTTGALPRPNWYTANLRGMPLSQGFSQQAYREQHFDCLACHVASQHRAGIDIFVDGDTRLDDDVAGRSWVSYATERIEGIGAPRVEVPPAGFMADKGPATSCGR